MIGIDMEMPKRCGECPIAMSMSFIPDVFYCPAIRQQITCEGHGEDKHPDCPLYPLDEEIQVGDEVCFEDGETFKAVVLDAVSVNELWCVLTENGCISIFDEKNIHRTGRHFDVVEALLKEIRGEYDG